MSCIVRLKGVLEQMDRGVVDLQELRRNIELAAAMLDTVYTDETRWADGARRNSRRTTERICRPRRYWQMFLSVTKASVGHRGRAQRPAGGVGAKRSTRLAGVHLQPEDGRGEASPRGEAEIQEHRPRSAGWDICGKVMETVFFISWMWLKIAHSWVKRGMVRSRSRWMGCFGDPKNVSWDM